MKLINKDDGRVREFGIDETKSFPYYLRDEFGNTYWAKTLKEIADRWEDYPEPKEYWAIDIYSREAENFTDNNGDVDKFNKAIGNYFETKEEAEKAVEKLKAWKRLKDNGFKFNGWNCALQELYFTVPDTFYDRPDMVGDAISDETRKDLDICFGGEE